jgi:pilus assembly protein CpaC
VNLLSTGAGNTPGVITTQQFSPPILGGSGSTGGVPGKLPLGVSDLLNIFLFRPDLNLGLTIKDLEQKNVLQILAEPNLMAISGQKATFLAGGEFPFPVVQSGQNGGAISVQFRPFGVRLDFTANVDSGRVVRLHVAPEVSTLDFTNAITVAGTTVPAISTRRAETEVELRDGQSFGIAGLLDNRAQTQLSKVPGIGDVPILGQLFKSRNVNRSNTELLVLVTPRILNPVDANTPEPTLPQPAIPFLDKPKFDVKLPGNDSAKMPEPTQSPR